MKAAFYSRKGDPHEVLQVAERPIPEPFARELLVRIAYSAVHPADVKRRAGTLAAPSYDEVIPHSDGSGTVVAVGPGLDSKTWLGQEVWISNAQRGRAHGTAAEYVTLPVELCRPIQPGYSLRDAACIGIPMICAHAAVFHHGPIKGKSLLVAGASGAVGRAALQWARWGGAKEIIAVVRKPSAIDLVASLGATRVHVHVDESIDPQNIVSFSKEIGTVDHIVDVDIGRNASWLQHVLSPQVVWSAYATSQPVALDFRQLMNSNATLRFIQTHSISATERHAALTDIDTIHREHAVSHTVGEIFPLRKVADAHAVLERGDSRGVVLISLAGTHE